MFILFISVYSKRQQKTELNDIFKFWYQNQVNVGMGGSICRAVAVAVRDEADVLGGLSHLRCSTYT